MVRFFKDHCEDIGEDGKDDRAGFGLVVLPEPGEIDIERYVEVKQMTFTDQDKIAPWAKDAVEWCVEHGLMQGKGEDVYKRQIQNMAQSFSNGEVEVLEDPARYHFDIRFVGSRGIPPNMDDLTAALEEIKPAHLTYAYIYVYNTYGFWTDYTLSLIHI